MSDFRIRNAQISDIPRLLELEELCWGPALRVTGKIIRERVERHSAGQFVLVADGVVRGVLYSQRIATVDALSSVRFDTADTLHESDGPIGHILSLNVDPADQGLRHADTLIEHALTWAAEDAGLDTVVGVTRCRDHAEHPGRPRRDHIHDVDGSGRSVDPVLRMHQSHGAEVRDLVAGYRPADEANGGNGVLVAYDLAHRAERVATAGPATGAAKLPSRDVLTDEVWAVLAELVEGGADLAPDELMTTPLFELGLDSLDLTTLEGRLADLFCLTLDPLFLFDHNTGAKIVAELDSARRPAEPVAAAPRSRDRDIAGDIAIVGMACRLPGGIEDPAAFWELLTSGDSAVGVLPPGRWAWPAGVSEQTHPGISRGGFTDSVDAFAADLFRVSPHEARRMDPQQRWMLELAWTCLEDAGYAAGAVAGSPTGVYIGASGSDYQRLMDAAGTVTKAHSGVGTSMAVIANRVSYFYDLHGPSVQVDTACSSSLVAVHAAVRALRAGDCSAALVGGVNVLCHPAGSIAFHEAGMLSPDGRCKTFDASADGYVRAEGGVMLLLKPLRDALDAGDHVYAVIAGAATNHGGQAGGLTVPSSARQAALVGAALADAGVTADAVSYVEAHGTGTALGDPIEVRGLTTAFKGSATPCGIGSVKPNVGHLEAAAGIAGLLKLVLCLRHRRLPASVNYERLNPRIELDHSPFFVVDAARAWDAPDGLPRIAGVSSFGSGGSNAHVIVREADEVPAPGERPESVLVPLSARTAEQLRTHAALLRDHLRTGQLSDADLADLAYTLRVGREQLAERVVLRVSTVAELESLLDAVARGERPDDVHDGPEVGADQGRRRLSLPTHAFLRKRYWITPPAPAEVTLTGAEPFLTDHHVHGAPTLPAAFGVELIRAALGTAPVRLTDLCWRRAVTVTDGPRRLRVAVDGARVELRADDFVHAECGGGRGGATEERIDLADLLGREWRTTIDADEYYPALAAGGLDYGPAHRAVREIRVGDGDLLVELTLPDAAAGEHVLHPSMLDGALQSVYATRTGGPGWTAALPFAVERLDITASSPTHAHAWIRETGTDRFDMDLCDDDGRVFAALRGYTVRDAVPTGPRVTLFEPVWRAEPATARVHGRRLVVTCGLRNPPDGAHVLDPADTAEAQLLGAFRTIKDALSDEPVHVQVLATDSPAAAALSGLLRSAHRENPALTGQVVTLPAGADARRALDEATTDHRVSGTGRDRQVLTWTPFDATGRSVPWRDGGVYLITGGAGGLGLIFAEEIARRAEDAVLCLTGRGALDPARQAKLDALPATVEYHQVDVTDATTTHDLVADLRRRHGALHGVLHAAGVLADDFLVHTTDAAFERVLAPKLRGCVNLDAATAGDALDVFVLFSSIMGAAGNVGQAGYATANAYLDAFARHRTGAGRTLSIGWPLWAEGGMGRDTATRSALAARAGMAPLPTAAGLDAFYRAMATTAPHVVVGAGDPDLLEAFLNGTTLNGTTLDDTEARAEHEVGDVLEFVRRSLAELIELPAAEIDDEESLGTYGMDSILAVQWTTSLEDTFGPLPKTLLFEHQSVRELAAYLGTKRRIAPVTAEPVPVPASSALDIAVIGLSGRYPQASDLREFWRNLSEGRDCVTEVPADRWDWREHYSADRAEQGRHHSRWGGFLDDIDRFDPLFFAISPHEADLIDPQERLFLEQAWHAMEDAGLTRADLRRAGTDGAPAQVGVYAGVMWGHYQLLFRHEDGSVGNPSAVASTYASVANRVSYALNLHGPSMTVDTMCSSSLTAIELACRDLRDGRTELAFAGGVNLTVHPAKYRSLSAGGFISSAGHCESFGRGGDGYVPSEGVGVVLLKRLADAVRDGDQVYGVIKGAGLSHGGRTSGYTVPNPRAQELAIRRAVAESGVDPREIGYVEAHGTGTSLGDPIEITALAGAFGDRDGTVHIGSVKSNIGHGEAAAGIAGLTKVLLQLRHRQLVPSLHSRVLNSNIDFGATPFEVNQELRPWEPATADGVRIAGLSSFGAGGANAHLVIAEHVTAPRAPLPGGPVVVPVSARDPERLDAYARALLDLLDTTAPLALADLAHTFQVGRESMTHRLAVVARSLPELAERLRRHLAGEREVPGVHTGDVKRDKQTRAAEPVAGTDPDTAARAWVTGATVRWERGEGRRISAPGYPFARERHWAPEPPRELARPRPGRERRMLTEAWRPAPLVPGGHGTGSVVVVHDDATRSLADGIVTHTVHTGPVELVDVSRGAAALRRGQAERCAVLVDLTGITGSVPTVKATVLLRGLLEVRRAEGVHLVFVTKGLEACDNPAMDLAGAARAGLYRMLAAEYGRVSSRHVDLAGSAAAATRAAEVDAPGGHTRVCYRGGVRQAPVLVDADLSAADLPAFGPDEVLLVTGGTRGVGLLTARHLVERCGARRVVLTGREALPPRRRWREPDAFPEGVRAKISAVLDLEARGVEVRVLALPLDNEDTVRAQLAEIESSWGPVTGLVHAAGLVDRDTPAFVAKSGPGIATVVAPKVEGTRNLLACLDPDALRFALLYSSVSAVVPALASGLSDYAMGNAYLDYAAHAESGRLPVTSVQWPSWRDTGFGEVTSPVYTDTGLLSISDEEGRALLDQVLATRHAPVIMPVVVDPDRFDPAALLAPAAAPAAAPVPRPATSGDAAPAALRDFLASTVEAELKLRSGRLDHDATFADYGADSILLAQVANKIKARLGDEFDLVLLLEHPTVEGLAAHLVAEHPERVAEVFGTAPVPAPRAPVVVARSGPGTAEPLAVIGMAARFPGAPDLDAYWDLLSNGRCAVRPVPAGRWGRATRFHAGLVDDVYGFDPGYFLLHPEDVRAMDPQALVLLEECLNAVHHAGYRPEDLSGTATGVYVGARARTDLTGRPVAAARNPIMAVGQNYLAANVSQFFDWRGPAVVFDTACSSSLVAMKVAADELASGAVDMAVVAGVSLLTSPADHELFDQRSLLRDGGDFHLFDKRAAGVVLGEGAGVVLLKPLAKAVEAGDTVYALVEGVAINNDGRTAGPATPNPQAQQQVMRAALERAQVTPADVAYLDANGSGSEVTDLLELKAIAAVYAEGRGGELAVGSMKPNIGHPLCAEGIAAFIKVALMVHHQRLVPFLSGHQPMTHQPSGAAGIVFPRESVAADLPHAALSSFADGGTNGHVVVGRHAGAPGTRAPLTPPRLSKVDVRGRVPAERPAAHRWTLTLDAEDPLIANHLVYGRRLLPGLAWIDLLHQRFAEAGLPPERLALHRLSLRRPVVLEPGTRIELVVTATPDEHGWRVAVMDEDGEPYVDAAAEVVEPADPPERVDLAGITGRTRQLAEIYRDYRDLELVHSGPMRAAGQAYAGSEEIWVRVVAEHPTCLVDASAATAMALLGEWHPVPRRLFLPLVFESFHASAPLRGSCFARVRRSSVRHRDELLTFSVEFFDYDGNPVAKLAEFTCKLVRHPGSIDPRRRVEPPRAVASGAPPVLEPAGSHRELVTAIVAGLLGSPSPDVDPDAAYYRLGLDSAALLSVVARLEERLGTRLSPTVVFEYPTIAELAAHLDRTLPSARTFAEEPPVRPEPVPAVPARSAVRSGDVAIVGLAGRYPGATDLAEFWQNLTEGRDCVSEVPADRWPLDALDDARSPSGRPAARIGGFLSDVDCFDADFFGIPATEAALMDPQERLFLEVCWAAVEDAGYTPASLVDATGAHARRPVGVYVGVMHSDYAFLQQAAAAQAGQPLPLALNAAQIANRVSHLCDFHGPSMAIDAVCASSLTAVHLALEGLRNNDCEAAIVGGVNLSLHPAKYRTYAALGLLTTGEPSRSFGGGSDGYVSAEGVGALVLKPLEVALADGDSVYAVIKGSAVNHSGRTAALRAPSVVAQEAVVAEALNRAGVDPATVSYVEAHGTGTELGDLIEVKALERAFGKDGPPGRCVLGSVKSVIGHAEAAAGVSGITKVALQLREKTLTRSLDAVKPNPHLDLTSSPFTVRTETRPWVAEPGVPRRAGVSAFGATGSNAHVVLEEAPPTERRPAPHAGAGVLIPLSARDPERLAAYAELLRGFLENRPDTELAAVAHTLQTGRIALGHRAALVVRDHRELVDGLAVLAAGHDAEHLWRGQVAESGGAELALLDEEDLRAFLVSRWAGQGDLAKIAKLWVLGYPVDWSVLHPTPPGRLHLPTYPFARQRHWVSPAVPGLAPAAPAEVPAETPTDHSAEYSAARQPLRWIVLPENAPVPAQARYRDLPAAAKALAFVRHLVAARLAMPPEQLDPDAGFLSLGMKSLAIVELSRDLAATVDPDFLPSTLFDHGTIALLADHIVDRPSLARLVAVPDPTRDEEATGP